MITVALAKGRLAQKATEILEKCGLKLDELKIETRKLVLYDNSGQFKFVFVKPSDVPTYVERGVADFGVVGKDTLLEADRDIYEMLDLKFGKCRMCVCGYPDSLTNAGGILKVGTKYDKITKEYFGAKGKTIDVIKLHGSIELAPIIGLADVIVDIVESGKTLEANGLQVLEEVCSCSARLVVNRVSLKTKKGLLELLEKIKENI
ncbi:MAG: ATP phosphoribosyltransferase [Clostridia bacterium]|nr:ATP phosphoribosyltransferase [Clostridia bacterium]